MEPINDKQPIVRLDWNHVWISVLTRPKVETFERILRDPEVNTRRAYLWVFISAIIGSSIQSLYIMFFTPGLEDFASPCLTIICSPVIAALAVLGVAINAGISQWVANRFYNGSGTYEQLVYTLSAIYAPIYLISGLITFIPYIQFLSIFLGIYALVLGVVAVKAVNRFSTGPAVASYLVVPLLLIFGIVVLTFALLAR